MSQEPETRKASVRKLVDPKYLSIVQSPANRSGFKIIRNDSGENEMVVLKRRVRRSAAPNTPLLSITLPVDTSQEEAQSVMEEFGLSEELYELTESDGRFTLIRRNTDSAESVSVNLANGMVARIEKTTAVARQDTSGVVLASLEFTGEQFQTVESVRGWLENNEIDFKEGGVEVTEGGIIITRQDASDTQKVDVAEGIVARVARAEISDVPIHLNSVAEYAYGQWGWGQLDFMATVADKAFSNQSEDAIYTLRNVLDQIVFYSDLPLEDRKDLIKNALDQFYVYMSTMIEALPRGAILAARQEKDPASTTTQREDEAMTKAVADNATQEDNKPVEDAQAIVDNTPSQGSEGTMTRSDVEKLVSEAVRSASSQSDEKVASALTEMTDIVKRMSESVTGLVEKVEGQDKALVQVTERIEEVESTTVVRSDENDSEEANTVQRSEDPFAGIFSNLLRAK